jgi:hypothetical protein
LKVFQQIYAIIDEKNGGILIDIPIVMTKYEGRIQKLARKRRLQPFPSLSAVIFANVEF